MGNRRKYSFVALIPTLALMATAILGVPIQRDAVAQSAADTGVDRVLKGAIDVHLHVDLTPYGADISTLKLAKSRGVRGVVIKNHYEPMKSTSPCWRNGKYPVWKSSAA